MRRGLTLLESMISLGLLVTVILFLLNLLPGSLVATRATECELQAHSLAESAMEEARAAGFANLTPGITNLPDRSLGGVLFHCQRRIFLPTGVNPQFVRGIRAEVWWEFSGRRRQLIRQTMVSNVKG